VQGNAAHLVLLLRDYRKIMSALKFQPIPEEPQGTGERDLMIAVFSYSARDYLNFGLNHDIEAHDHRQAEAWFESKSFEPFSFEWISLHLNYDTRILRPLLKHKRRNGIRWEIQRD
jgi:hypothetical protein